MGEVVKLKKKPRRVVDVQPRDVITTLSAGFKIFKKEWEKKDDKHKGR